jgi:dUTP pyrophosphatase
MINLELRILDERLYPDHVPDYATDEAAAIDLRACSIEGLMIGEDTQRVTVLPGGRAKIGTGIAIDVGTPGRQGAPLAGLILPRSGLGSRGITLGNAPGLLDGDYQGELFLALWNAGIEPLEIGPLDRLAQLVIVPIVRPTFQIVSAFTRTTQRGEGGFGSTGSN